MELTSQSFSHNTDMPATYTCDGKDINPHLAWSGEPEGTKSFALRVFDPDAPGNGWIHWQIINIPAGTHEIKEDSVPQGAEEILNDFGKTSYGGPCPPSGKHRYVFTIYALDTERLDGVTKDTFLNKVQEHTLAKAELIGLYQRR
ncbi:YbhB/YbcL family Raf kinase inhibitor-like protein [Candidatus Woesearchaeota archaeon]|nr:MAG: YbhB/YbcL family Raf kinase inhibitor-like protein [Candidatus Woesearchaeota archaeon]